MKSLIKGTAGVFFTPRRRLRYAGWRRRRREERRREHRPGKGGRGAGGAKGRQEVDEILLARGKLISPLLLARVFNPEGVFRGVQ